MKNRLLSTAITILISTALSLTISIYFLDFTFWLEKHDALWIMFAAWLGIGLIAGGVPLIRGIC